MTTRDPGEGLSRRELIQVGALVVAGVAAAQTARAAEPVTVAGYIARRLTELGVDAFFGVPGATCEPMFEAAHAAKLRVVVTASDLEAGYAADGYARFRALGPVCLTYGVGAMAILPVVAGAYAERSPMLVLNGGPTPDDLRLQEQRGTLFSHSSGRPGADLAMFREVTARAERVERAVDAPAVIDALLRDAITLQRPVYLEIPKQLWTATCTASGGPLEVRLPPTGQEEAVAAEIATRLAAAKRPVLLLGIELARYRLADAATALVTHLGLPWTSTALAKAVIAEDTPGFLGVYVGNRAAPALRERVEGADAVLALGCVFGRQLRALATGAPDRLLRVADGQARIGAADPRPVALDALLRELVGATPPRAAGPTPRLSFAARRRGLPAKPPSPSFASEAGLAVEQVLEAISDRLSADTLVIPDTSLSMFPAVDLAVHGRDAWLANGVWQAIGYSVAAAAGAALAQPRRPVVICGDGGFQMTAQALSTLAQHGIPAIVVVLDNGLYAIEQWLLRPGWYTAPSPTPPLPHLELARWDHPALARALGVPAAVAVATPDALAQALDRAFAGREPTLIAARIRPHDLPTELRA